VVSRRIRDVRKSDEGVDERAGMGTEKWAPGVRPNQLGPWASDLPAHPRWPFALLLPSPNHRRPLVLLPSSFPGVAHYIVQ